MRGAAIAIALSAAIGSIGTIAAHERARAEWQRERDALGTDRYDAARSDAAWDRAHAWRGWAERAAMIAALALVIAAAISAPPGAASQEAPRPPSETRMLAATALDALGTLALIAAGTAAAGLARSPAVADALAWWLPAIPLAIHAALLARGASAGMRALGVAIPRPPPLRTALAALATPVASLALPIVAIAWLAGRRWPAPHLAIAGIAITGIPRGPARA